MIFIYLFSGYKPGKTGARADGLAVSSGVHPVLPTHCSHLWSLVSGTGRFIARTSRHWQVVMMSVSFGCDASVPFTRFQTPGWQILTNNSHRLALPPPSSHETLQHSQDVTWLYQVMSYWRLNCALLWNGLISYFMHSWRQKPENAYVQHLRLHDIALIFFFRVLFLSRIHLCLAHRDLNHDCCLKKAGIFLASSHWQPFRPNHWLKKEPLASLLQPVVINALEIYRMCAKTSLKELFFNRLAPQQMLNCTCIGGHQRKSWASAEQLYFCL